MTPKTLAPIIGAAFLLAACGEPEFIPLTADDLREDAAKGNSSAQAQLGQEYLVGSLSGPTNGFDITTAKLWLQRAAAQNEPMALYLLGAMRENGQGFERDLKAAMTFYLRAAELNNGPAQEALARVYAQGGLGMPDYVESHKWQILANKHGWRLDADNFFARDKLTSQELKLAELAADELAATF